MIQFMAPKKSPTASGKNWVRLIVDAIPDPKGKRDHITLEDFAAKVGAGHELVRKWSTGANPGFKYSQQIRKLFPREAALADEAVGIAPAPPMSDSSGKVASSTDQGDHRNDSHALLEEELRRRGKAISDDARKVLATAIRSRRYGPQNADEARDYIDGLLEVFADASRGESR
jgi:hypothetical protein